MSSLQSFIARGDLIGAELGKHNNKGISRCRYLFGLRLRRGSRTALQRTVAHLTDVRPSQLSYQQLKLGHRYFLSYLSKLPDYDTNICNKCYTNQKQNPYHLIFHCPGSLVARKNTIGKINPRDQNLYYLFTNRTGQETLIEFLKESKIASRKWFIETPTD